MGSLFGLGGQALFEYRIWLTRIGGVLVVFFGLYMTGILKLKFLNFLNYEKKIHANSKLKPGEPGSALILGGIFAFGWTPCVGPILGAILTLAAASATVSQGIILLAIFSAGLAIPFLLVALFSGYALERIQKIQRHLNKISIAGGVLLIFFGILLLTNQFAQWTQFIFQLFDFLNYEGIQNHL